MTTTRLLFKNAHSMSVRLEAFVVGGIGATVTVETASRPVFRVIILVAAGSAHIFPSNLCQISISIEDWFGIATLASILAPNLIPEARNAPGHISKGIFRTRIPCHTIDMSIADRYTTCKLLRPSGQ
jgi:hypothetical protein